MKTNLIIGFMWAILSMVVTGIFWGFWYLVNGNVPNYGQSIRVCEELTLKCPFTISAWANIIFVPIFTMIIYFGFERISNKIGGTIPPQVKHEIIVANIFMTIIGGPVIGVIFPLAILFYFLVSLILA